MRAIVGAVMTAAAIAVHASVMHSQERDTRIWQAIGVKTVGATAGSALGVLGTIKIGRRCGAEDLSCHLRRIGIAGVASVIGASSVGYIAARTLPPSVATEPMFPGLLVGAVVGVAGGAGMIKLMDEAGSNPSGMTALLVYSLTQGLLTAVISELLPFGGRQMPL
jgi:hypothetical protein